MSNIIIFGDSISAGQNSKVKYSDYLDGKVINKAVSGTTIGEYSIYPVDGYSLLSLYNKDDRIKDADTILLEYGINDTTAVLCDFIDVNKIMLNFVKALDGIKQINPKANIKFLSFSDRNDVLLNYASLQCDYLANDYFRNYDFSFPVSLWADTYKFIVDGISRSIDVVPMIYDVDFLDKYISSDSIHPNEDGHRLISINLQQCLN